jgi:hypothetical protein
MKATPTRPALTMCRDDVIGRMEQGQPFDEVENVIDLADVSEDQRAALWLMAFAMRDQRDQQRDARAHLALVAEH